MARVSTCPKNLTEVEVASTRLKCGTDEHGHSQYMCLPNVEKTSLVEFCYKDTLGSRQKGECLVASGGNLTTSSCVHFSSGCPENIFYDYEFFKYQACQQIKPNQQCYTLDPKCVPKDGDYWNLYLSILLTVGVSVVLLWIFVLILRLVSRKSRTENPDEEDDELLRKEEEAKRLSQEAAERLRKEEAEGHRKKKKTKSERKHKRMDPSACEEAIQLHNITQQDIGRNNKTSTVARKQLITTARVHTPEMM